MVVMWYRTSEEAILNIDDEKSLSANWTLPAPTTAGDNSLEVDRMLWIGGWHYCDYLYKLQFTHSDKHRKRKAFRERKPPPRQLQCGPNPNVSWSRSPPKSNQFLLITRRTLPKISSKFLNNFLSYPTNRQTDWQTSGKTYPPWLR